MITQSLPSIQPARRIKEQIQGFRCEDCGWETPFGELFGLKLGCQLCGGALVQHGEHELTLSTSP